MKYGNWNCKDVTMMEMEVNLEGEEKMNMTSTNYTRPASSCFEADIGILGNLRMDSMDYLFPLLAQYCVISAAILLVIWNQVRSESSIVLFLIKIMKYFPPDKSMINYHPYFYDHTRGRAPHQNG